MTIEQAFEQMEQNCGPFNEYSLNPMFDIVFKNNESPLDGLDVTEFTCESGKKREETIEELSELFSDFCKENEFNEDSVETIIFMGPDPFYEGVIDNV